MTLIDRFLAELQRLDSLSHPIARTLPGIVRVWERRAIWIFRLAVCVAFALGFLACYAWLGVRLEVLSSTVEEWRRVAETEYRTHHAPVAVTEPQARVIIQRKHDARRRKP